MGEKTEMDRGMEQIPPNKHPEILRIAHKYRIDENDPAWILVNLVLESLNGIDKITTERTKTLREAAGAVTNAIKGEIKIAQEKAMLEIAKSQEQSKTALNQALSQMMDATVQRAVGQIVQSTHSQALRTQARKWAVIWTVTAIVLLAGVAWDGYRAGLSTGYSLGIVAGGNFRHFLACDVPGWNRKQKKDGSIWCYPMPTKKGTYGWRVR